jgi:hypothetical protein
LGDDRRCDAEKSVASPVWEDARRTLLCSLLGSSADAAPADADSTIARAHAILVMVSPPNAAGPQYSGGLPAKDRSQGRPVKGGSPA